MTISREPGDIALERVAARKYRTFVSEGRRPRARSHAKTRIGPRRMCDTAEAAHFDGRGRPSCNIRTALRHQFFKLTRPERLACVRHALSRFRKYGNLLDLIPPTPHQVEA